MNVSKQNNIPFIQFVDLNGNLTTPKWNGIFAKKADPLIIEDLKERGLLFKKELYEHDYPFAGDAIHRFYIMQKHLGLSR